MTILGMGIDLVAIHRIKEAMENPGFLEKILTEKERAIVTTPESVAGRWAAKEALMKTGCEVKTFKEIEILPDESGRPTVMKPEGSWMVSITHEKEMAAAVVLRLGE